MKLFGLGTSRTQKTIGDANFIIRSVAPPPSASAPGSKAMSISQVKQVAPNVLTYAQQWAGGRGYFLPAEYDLSEIGVIEDTDSFVRQAFKKKIGLMFKEGLGYSGANKNTIKYIKTRMTQIAQASNIPTIELMKRVSHSLIRTSNAFIVKVRKLESSGGKTRDAFQKKDLEPVAGYFPAAPETMHVDINHDNGKVMGWRQLLPNGRYRNFPVQDVVHFTIDRREGFVFGVPTLIPVIDDIRALRQIEENIELLLYQHLFPLFHYKVGTENAPAGYTEDGLREVDVVKEEIKLMPTEGGIVTDERHNVEAIGSEGRAVRAEGYLDHFKKRVIAGLGISSIDLGDGDTTNRATANTLSRALIDAVKDVQDAFEAQWDHEIVKELLLESTFGEDILEEETMVHLQFAEIDVQNKMDQQKHAVEVFQANGITYDELRSELAKEPIPLPEDPEDQDLSKYPEWAQTHWKLFEEPTKLISAVDEPYSMAAQAATESRSLSLTKKAAAAEITAKEKAIQKEAEEDRKTKVATSQKATSKKDNFIEKGFRELESDTEGRIRNGLKSRGSLNQEYLMAHAYTWAADVIEKFSSLASSQLIRGFNDQTGGQASKAADLVVIGRSTVRVRVEHTVNKLAESVIRMLTRRVDESTGDVTLAERERAYISELHTSFDSVRYRTRFIWDVELRKAYNYGRVLGVKFANELGVEIVPEDEACVRCQALKGTIQDPTFVTMEDIAPIHPGCKCSLKVVTHRDMAEIEDKYSSETTSKPDPSVARKEGSNAIDPGDENVRNDTIVCPDCTNTAILQPRSGTYYCQKCRKSYLRADDKSVKKGS